MSIKYFNSNENNKFEFTREELENLLNDVYEEGKKNEEPLPLLEILAKAKPAAYNEATESISSIYCTDTDSIGKIVLEKIKGE